MKKIFISFSLLFFFLVSSAQQTEFYAGVNTGFLSFRGKSAEKSSFITQSDVTSIPNTTNDIYGRKAGAGIGIDLSLQRVTRSEIIFGIAAGVEILKSKINIDAIWGRSGISVAEGSVRLTSKFINIRPAAGYRFQVNKKLAIDVTGNLDLAFCISPHHEKGSATISGSGGNTVTTDIDRDKTGLDFRTGLQTRINYRRYSLLAGYWVGQTNYYKDYIGGNAEAYSRLFRAGISYRLTK
ncbi:MAG: outer membrane beta-barrel protein [Ferruginibacter sp.]|nr:outer membrane beta-barrel protein [Chitinophagaceae bacterium]